MLSPLGLTPSFGFGDRLGLATPGHIAAARGTKFALGSGLAQFGMDLKAALVKHGGVYYDGLKAHFEKHLILPE